MLDEQAALPRVVASIRSDGQEALYAYGPEGLHAQHTISGTTDTASYALLDAQGSLKHLTDSSGALSLTRVYDAWGTLRYTAGSGASRLGYTGELQDGSLVYLRARWYHTGLGTFTSRDSYAGTPDRPQSLHRYGYGENRPTMLSDPSGYSVDEYGHWTPCNMLPGRTDSCSLQDYVDWWGSESGDKFRRFSVTVVTDVGAALAAIPDIPYQILTNPQGVIWGILYGPIGVVENAVGGFVCGDPEKLGHVVSGYGMFVVGGVLKSLHDTPVQPPPKAEVQIIAFQGAGSKFQASLENSHPLTYAGHVGISFDGGKTIYGFTPFTPGETGATVLKNLKAGKTYPGIVGDDTAVFQHAYDYAQQLAHKGRLPSSPRLEIYVWRQQVSLTEFNRMYAAVLDEMAKSPMEGKRYGFPVPGIDEICWNCATKPETFGIQLPELTGVLRDYIQSVIEQGIGERWLPPQ